MRVLLIYPNTYSVAMSNLGFQSVYSLFSDRDDCVVERAFMPDPEDLEEFERSGTPLFSLETQTPASDFDIIAFSISFEDDYLSLPRIFELARVELRESKRGEASPLVIAGGAAISLNPEPIVDFFDLFLLGEGEGAIDSLLSKYSSGSGGDPSREAFVEGFSRLRGVYVPSLYEFSFDGSVVIAATPLKGAPARVEALKNSDIDSVPMPRSHILTPETEFSDTELMEIERGCGHGCRFCGAGFIYLPPRFRKEETVRGALLEGCRGGGKIGLVGAAVSEYPGLKGLLVECAEAGADVTLSSLRADKIDAEMLSLLKSTGLGTVTMAPEAGSPRLRDVINKRLTDETILEAARLVREQGFKRLRLYFMIGLPTETDEDVEKIVELVGRLRDVAKGVNLTVSVNPFVPKPSTPFQWAAFCDEGTLKRRIKIIKKALGAVGGVELKIASVRKAMLQAFLSRGDRRLGAFIENAARDGITPALREFSVIFKESLFRQRSVEEIFAWDFVDHGIDKGYLYDEFCRALCAKTTPPCNVGACTRCGVC